MATPNSSDSGRGSDKNAEAPQPANGIKGIPDRSKRALFWKRGLWLLVFLESLAILLFALLAGNPSPDHHVRRPAPAAAPPGSISVYRLASDLNLRVTQSSARFASLVGRQRQVTIYGPPACGLYVNGHLVPSVRGIMEIGGTILLSRQIVRTIRQRLSIAVPTTRPAKPVKADSQPVPSACVVVDPGHGGKDTGAIGVGGIEEKRVALAVSLDLARVLRERGVSARLTRTNDSFVELGNRAAYANRCKADLFVSVHCNSAASPSAHGFAVYVARSACPLSLQAAEVIRHRLTALGLASRGIRRADFRVLVCTNGPAVLIELGFVSNPAEATQLASPRFQRRLGLAIGRAVLDFLDEAK